MSVKRLLERLLPPIRRRRGCAAYATGPQPDRLRFTGDFASWEEAAQASSGYAAPVILEKTRAALLRVKNGEAAYERDSVTFATIDYEFPLLACLLRAAAEHDNRLSVLDFGGSLGSTYFQCRSFLAPLKELRWSIVEQPAHVLCGQRDFANEQLRFYESVESCLRVERPQVLLLSGVLQCLPKPYVVLEDLIGQAFDYILRGSNRVSARRRGSADAGARAGLDLPGGVSVVVSLRGTVPGVCLPDTYELLASFRALDTTHPDGGEADYKGFLFRRRRQPANA